MKDPDQIRRWVSEAEAKVALLTDESDRVGRELTNARRQLALLHELLATWTNSPAAVQLAVEPLSTRDRVIRDTEQILSDGKGPMRIGDIHAQFIRRGYALPGRGSPTNLVAHLGKTDRIVRLERGVYALPSRVEPEPKGEEEP